MFRKTLVQHFMALLGIAIAGGLAHAQYGPSAGAGPTATSQLNSIHRDAVGTGHTVESLNRIALNNAQARVPSVGQLGVTASGRPSSIGLNSSPANKPFSSYSPAPTTSPYLNLFREDFDGNSDLNYNTLVRPMLQQQRFNEQLQRQSQDINRRLQSLSAQADFNPQGSTTQQPTGHRTVFNYLGHFYPTPARQR